MAELNVREVAKVLLQDEVLLQERQKFARSLNITACNISECDYHFRQGTISLDDFFTNLIQLWKSQQGREATISSLVKILKENGFNATADNLQTQALSGEQPNCLISKVTSPIHNFVGREKEVEQLLLLFSNKSGFAVVVSAIGGQGKTELCRKFIQQLPTDKHIINVTWLSGDNAQLLIQSLSEFAWTLKLSLTDPTGKPLPLPKLINNIAQKMTRNCKWLVVVDNVDKTYVEFITAIHAFVRHKAFILVTSRRTDILTDSEHIDLQPLEDRDAWQFVEISLNPPQSHKLVVELCKSLQNYALALQQAVAFIKYKKRVTDSSYSIQNYLEQLNMGIADMGKVVAFDHQLQSCEYDKTTFKIVTGVLAQLREIDERSETEVVSLLLIMTLVEPDGIELNFLTLLFCILEQEKLIAKSLEVLKTLSLIRIENKIVSIHRLVQQITFYCIRSDPFWNWAVNLCNLLHNINLTVLTKREIVHVLQIWSIAASDQVLVKYNSSFAIEICNRLKEISLYREMKQFAQSNFEIFSKILGPDHIDTLTIEGCWAIALTVNGEYEESLIKSKEVWEKEKKVLGEEHETTLITANYIANALYCLDRHSESLEWFQRVLESRIKVHGENHHNTMSTKSNIAVVLNSQGKSGERRGEEESIYKKMLALREKEFGHQDPSTLGTRTNIATCLYYQGKFVEAKEELEQVLELEVKVLGEEHAQTLNTKLNLSHTLYSLDRKEEALKMVENVLIVQEKTFGTNHPHTITTRNYVLEWKSVTQK